MKRVAATKAFSRRTDLSDQALYDAAAEIQQGLYEADLGGGVVKKRVAYPGRGKSGSTRVLVAIRVKGLVIFLTGRDKSTPGTDFTVGQIEAAKVLARQFTALTATQLNEAIESGALKEICNAA
jgi:hypothetical protein